MYKALYREYRPRAFSEVLGQEHITRTLKNQIRSGNIGHAYLFCGERGTGKTSTAKIFARAVSCLQPLEGDPCNQCEACRVSLSEESLDIVEMDAASNRTIANIRSLKEMVNYPPTHLARKVYIIDEVHMLTSEAFNALLKTLEEPPSYVIFILATTEPEKLPETILSRCQRFDFRRVSDLSLQQNIERILKDFGRTIEDAALRLIVSNAEGSVRDSLSLLDRLVGYSESVLRYEDALEVLGAVDRTRLLNLAERFFSGDLKSVLLEVSSLSDSGKDIAQLLRDFIREIRNLMLVKIVGEHAREILFLGEEEYREYCRIVSGVSYSEMERVLSSLLEKENLIRWSTQPRILFEAALMTLIRVDGEFQEEHMDEKKTSRLNTRSIPKEEKFSGSMDEETLLKVEESTKSEEPSVKDNQETLKETEESSKAETSTTVGVSKEQKKSETESVAEDEQHSPPPLDVDMIGREWKNVCNDLSGLTKLVCIKLKPWRWENGILSLDTEALDGFEVSSISSQAKQKEIESVLKIYFGIEMQIRIGKNRLSDAVQKIPKKMEISRQPKEIDAQKIREYFKDYLKS